MGLLERIKEANSTPAKSEDRTAIDQWLSDYLLPASEFIFNGYTYGYGDYKVQQTYPNIGGRVKEISDSLDSYSNALKRCPPAFAAQAVRSMVLSQARFKFRNLQTASNGSRKIYGNKDLMLLERPWLGGTTADLIQKMEWHAGVAGNAYVVRQGSKRLRVLRPDWVGIVYGSQLDPDNPELALDGEIVGYVYVNGGWNQPDLTIDTITVDSVAHWAPLPDPTCANKGMSWITPAVREMQVDMKATEHKLAFYANGATPNLVIKGIPAATKKQFLEAVNELEANHTGVANAYKTLYLSGGADATVVGSTFAEMDFVNMLSASETRISSLSRVPPIILGISEGLKGAALNAGNFGQVRRMFADTWIYPELRGLASALAPIINVPNDSELWYDTQDMPILREDETDAVNIVKAQASTIGQLVRDGFTPESATAAVMSKDMTLLKPIPGWISVQLQSMTNAQNKNQPGNNNPPSGDGNTDPTPPNPAGGNGNPTPPPNKGK